MEGKRIRMIAALLLIVFYILFNYRYIYIDIFKGEICVEKAKTMDLKFSGRIGRKFLDSANHCNRAIEVINNGSRETIYFIDNEDSLLWKKITINDSIEKKGNSLLFLLRHKNKTEKLTVYYNCK